MRIDELIIEIQEAIEENDLRLAETKVNHALILDQNNIDVLKLQFFLLLETNRDLEAEKVLNEVINLDDQAIDMLLFKAAKLNDDGEPHEAIKLCNMIININPEFYTAFSFRGLFKHNIEASEESYQDLNYAVSNDKHNPIVFHNRGMVNQSNEILDQALKDFNKSIRLDKEANDSKFYKAITLRLLGKDHKAYKVIKNIKLEQLTDPEELVQAAVIYKNNNDFDKSLFFLDIAIKIDITFARAHYTRFLINMEILKFVEAEWDLDNAIKSDDESFRNFILNGYAHLYYKTKRYNKSIEVANSALKEYPNFFWLNLTLAEVYGELEKKKELYHNLEIAIDGGVGLENIDKGVREKYSKDKVFKKYIKKLKKKKHYG